MKVPMLNGYFIWQVRHLLRSAGWFGMASLGLAMLILMLHFWGTLPLRASVESMRDEAENLRNHVVAQRATDSSQDPGEQLKEFYRFFPKNVVITNVLGRIYAAASQENLVLEHGEYELVPTQVGNLLRYNLTLPIKGPYTKLRHFIAKVLRANPSLALDGVSFSRQGAMDIGVSAQVRMTLFVRAE